MQQNVNKMSTKVHVKKRFYHSHSFKNGWRRFHSNHGSSRVSLHAAGQVSLSSRVADPRSKSDVSSLISTLYVVHLWPLCLWGQTGPHTSCGRWVWPVESRNVYWRQVALKRPIIFSTWDNNNKKNKLWDIDTRTWGQKSNMSPELSVHFEGHAELLS